MVNKYTGEVYVNKVVLSGSDARRFEDKPLYLARARLYIENEAVCVGRQGSQTYPIAASGEMVFHFLDLSDLWFHNKVSGSAATVHIIGSACWL